MIIKAIFVRIGVRGGVTRLSQDNSRFTEYIKEESHSWPIAGVC